MNHPSTDQLNSYVADSSLIPSEIKSKEKEKTDRIGAILELAKENCEIWKDQNGSLHALTKDTNCNLTLDGKSSSFNDWLLTLIYEKTRKAPSKSDVETVATILKSRESKCAPTYRSSVRVGGTTKEIWLDLCNLSHTTVRITAEGWELNTDSDVRFRRPKTLHSLPIPVHGTKQDMDEFLELLNINEKLLTTGFLVSCFMPAGPFFTLKIDGPKGSGKTTASREVKNVIDPTAVGVTAIKKRTQDLAITISNCWLPAFDNISWISQEQSDFICGINTGRSNVERVLYENDEEKVFSGSRPMLLNGITEFGNAQDLLDRTICISMGPIKRTGRKTEKELEQRLNILRPKVLGFLLDAVAHAIQHLDSVEVSELPRNADAAKFVTAAEPFLGYDRGSFITELENNRLANQQANLESTPLIYWIESQLDRQDEVRGTMTELLNKMTSEPWAPKSVVALRSQLKRNVGYLLDLGIDWIKPGDDGNPRGKERTHIFRRCNAGCNTPPGQASVTVVDAVAGESKLSAFLREKENVR